MSLTFVEERSGEEPQEGQPVRDSATLILDKDVLVEHSPFFGAQLSERWVNKNSKESAQNETSARTITFSVSCPVADSVLAIRKLYEAHNCAEKEHQFSCFSEAFRCLQPADHLSLDQLLSGAVRFLSYVPWTKAQSEQIKSFLESSACPPESLTKRMAPLSEEQRLTLLRQLFKTASCGDSIRGAEQAREMLSILAGLPQFKTGVFAEEQGKFLDDVRASLQQLKAHQIALVGQGAFVHDSRRNKLQVILSSAAWILAEPKLGGTGACGEKIKLRDFFLEVKKSLPKNAYRSVYCEILCPAYLPLLQDVRKGKLVLDEDRRCELLSLWEYIERGSCDKALGKEDAYDQVEAEFLKILATLPEDRQIAVLEPWMTDLLQPKESKRNGRYWEPWFEAWVQEFFIRPRKDVTVRV